MKKLVLKTLALLVLAASLGCSGGNAVTPPSDTTISTEKATERGKDKREGRPKIPNQ